MNQPSARDQRAQGANAARAPRRDALAAFARRPPRPLAWGIWAVATLLSLVVFATSLAGYVQQLQRLCSDAAVDCAPGQLTQGQDIILNAHGLSHNTYTVLLVTVSVVSALVWYGVVAALVWRRADDGMALLVGLLLLAGGPVVATAPVYGPKWSLPGIYGAGSLPFFFLLVLVFCLFPDGRFVPRWTRGLPVACIGTYLALVIDNWPLFVMLVLPLLFSLAVAQISRYQHVSSASQRQQTKWVVFGVAILVAAFATYVVGYGNMPDALLSDPVFQLLNIVVIDLIFLVLPVTMGIAILRYHLFDIDLLIHQVLVYGSLTLLLGLLYAGSVILLQLVVRGLTGQTSPVAIVASTLLIAALFAPLRRRIQTAIDQRFYRRKYDAALTLAAFGATMRREVDQARLREQVLSVVAETMQPAFVSLWIRPPTPVMPPAEELQAGHAPDPLSEKA